MNREKNIRTQLVKRNIILSFFIKGWACAIQFFIVPLSLLCLSSYEYGLWLTINSILMGLDSIDVGFGNGLRNKLAEAVALGNIKKARQITSTTFLMLLLLILPLIIVTDIIILNTDCYKLMNVSSSLVKDFDAILSTSITLMGLTFVLKFIDNVYQGMQMPAISNLITVLGQTLSFFIIYAISLNGKSNLFMISLVFTSSPLIIHLIAYPITFYKKYTYLKPSIRYFDKPTLYSLLNLGVLFFIIQVSGMFLFMFSNFIITKVISAEYVTPYQIAYRYFSLLYMIFIIITTPLWNATTDAYTRKDYLWIKKIVRKLRVLQLLCIFLVAIMIAISSFFFHLWVGDNIHIDMTLRFLMAIYIIVLIVSISYSTILFGIGKIKLMAIFSICEVLFFVPLEYFICKNYGINYLLCTIIVAAILMAYINYIQFKRIIKNTAKGIWNK